MNFYFIPTHELKPGQKVRTQQQAWWEATTSGTAIETQWKRADELRVGDIVSKHVLGIALNPHEVTRIWRQGNWYKVQTVFFKPNRFAGLREVWTLYAHDQVEYYPFEDDISDVDIRPEPPAMPIR